MGAPIYGRYELFRELRKIIDLPDGILDMEIRMPLDEIPTITVASPSQRNSFRPVRFARRRIHAATTM